MIFACDLKHFLMIFACDLKHFSTFATDNQ